MNQSRLCDQCGVELPREASEGLCPRCLLGAALQLSADLALHPPQTSLLPESVVALEGASPQRSHRPVRFGDYELLDRIASGGMGIVYKARQVSLNRIVAIKALPFGRFTRDAFVRRFQAEAEAAAKLRHPNIVAIHEVGDHEGQAYFAMDYIEGPNLAEASRDQPFALARAVRLVRTIAEAIHSAHEKGILHRDLKPSNILIDRLDQPHITDFGLAKDLSIESDLTLSGQTLGSPNYIPPEQAEGRHRQVGRPSDVYALGAILYHLMTGRPPFVGESLTATLQQVAHSEPVAPRWLNPQVPLDLQTICLKCLEKDPAKRYQTAQALAEELGRWQSGEAVWARPVGAFEHGWRWCRRKPALAGLSAATALLMLTFGVGAPIALVRINRARANAQTILQQQRVRLAEELFSRNETQQAVGYLTRVLREDPSHYLAANRLMSALTLRRFPVPVTPLLTHQQAIKQVAFSPTGELAATASADGTAQVWNVHTGTPSGSPLKHPPLGDASFRSFSNIVWSVVFSPDGAKVATASANGAARIWDARTGQALTDWLKHDSNSPEPSDSADAIEFHPGHAPRGVIWKQFPGGARERKVISEPKGVTAVGFTRDGTRLITTGDDGLARWWKVSNGEPLFSLSHDGLVCNFAVSPDERFLVTCCYDRNAYVWDLTSQRLLAKLPHDSRVWTADFTPDGQWLLTGERQGRARLWKRTGQDWKWERDLQNNLGEVFVVRVTPDGKKALTASSSRQVQVFDLPSGRELQMHSEYAAVRDIDLSPDGTLVAVAAGGEEANIYDVNSGERVTEPLRTMNLAAVRFSTDGQHVLTGSGDGLAQIWDLQRQPRADRFEHGAGWVRSGAVSPDGRLLATGGDNGSVKIWSVQTGRLLHRLPHEGFVLVVRFSPDGRRLVTGSDSGSAKVWNVQDGQQVGPTLQHGDAVKDCRFSHDGRWLVTASADWAAYLWDGQTLAQVRKFSHHNDVRTAVFSPDGQRIVTASDDRSACVWSAATGQRLTPPLQHMDEVLSAEFSPDGRFVATASRDSTARVWNAFTGEGITPFIHHRSVVSVARFDESGRLLVTASEDRTARVWDARTGIPLTESLPHNFQVSEVAIGPNARWLATSEEQGAALGLHAGTPAYGVTRIWHLATGQLLSEPLPNAGTAVWLNPDATRVFTTAKDSTARIWDAPNADLPVPPWMLDLAETLVGRRQTAHGVELISPGELYQLRSRHASRPGNDYYDRWARWFFADPARRSLTPRSSRTVTEYVNLLLENGTYTSVCEAAELSPNNPRAAAMLAELEASQTPPNFAAADFHSRRALELAPNDQHCRDVRDRVSQRISQSPSRLENERRLAPQPPQ